MTSAQVAELAKEKGSKGYLNTKLIEWPPTRDSFKLLCKALNMEISESKILDAIICCRGIKMEDEPEENFSMEKLIQWFSRNIKLLKHLKYEFADQEWSSANPHISRDNVLRFKTPIQRNNVPDPKNYLKKTPVWDKLGY